MDCKLFLLSIFLFPSVCLGGDWTKTDTALQATYTILHLVDWSQTLEIAQDDSIYRVKNLSMGSIVINTHPDYIYESNPFLGKRPSRGKINRYFAGSLVGHYLVARWLNKPWRNIWQSFWIGTEYNVITHNKRNGFKISMSF